LGTLTDVIMVLATGPPVRPDSTRSFRRVPTSTHATTHNADAPRSPKSGPAALSPHRPHVTA